MNIVKAWQLAGLLSASIAAGAYAQTSTPPPADGTQTTMTAPVDSKAKQDQLNQNAKAEKDQGKAYKQQSKADKQQAKALKAEQKAAKSKAAAPSNAAQATPQ